MEYFSYLAAVRLITRISGMNVLKIWHQLLHQFQNIFSGFVLSALLLMFEFCMGGLRPDLASGKDGNRTPITPFTM